MDSFVLTLARSGAGKPGSAAEELLHRVVGLGGEPEDEGPPATRSGAARVLPYRNLDRSSFSTLRCWDLRANEL